ncbi:MAG: barnase inhibitor, partial [Ramlibacter sp.]
MDMPLRTETTENALKSVRTNIVQSIRAFRVQDLQDAAST